MASLYKKPVFITDPRSGKQIKKKSKKWWGRYRDEHGLEKRVPLAADKMAAQTMLHALVVKVERKAAGIEDPFEKHRKRPLQDHLADFKACVENKGATTDYVNTTNQRVEDIIVACKSERIDQISASRVLEHLAGLREEQMLRKDMAAARKAWLEETKDERERKVREQTSFLLDVDQNGFVVDFHALRKTFITNLTRSGVAPKTAQLLARHSDINLTMNTYTMLGVHDQATAVEALPPIPTRLSGVDAERALATGSDGRNVPNKRPEKVPPVVPRGAENGAERAASPTIRLAPDCTEVDETRRSPRRLENAKSPDKTGASRAPSHRAASQCSQVPEEGVEPSHPFGYWILNPARLPFRHSGKWLPCTSLRLVYQSVKRPRVGRAQRACRITCIAELC
jgi:hypothetical protein